VVSYQKAVCLSIINSNFFIFSTFLPQVKTPG